jgi:D-glycero-alpha-D-manno-heptose-7-phosphate kinase
MIWPMGDAPAPLRTVNAVAPIRICDNGGWTDTWFAHHGKVCNIAVSPCAEVQVHVHPLRALPARVVLDAENYGDRYGFDPGDPPGRHPLVEAAVGYVALPPDASVEVNIFSSAPAGCSTGTSASVTVALIGALDRLTPGRLGRHAVADAAHRVETERLGAQAGVQDQLSAAYGGINFIEVPAYPQATVTRLAVPDTVWWELERRLALVFLGRAHVSSDVHDRVIAGLVHEGEASPHLDALRHAAEVARDAIEAGDFPALGRAMARNTEAQAGLDASLVSTDAQRAIDVAREHGALGCKVNGAGGEGGSITVLCGPDMRAKRELLGALESSGPNVRVIPIGLSRRGLRVWET